METRTLYIAATIPATREEVFAVLTDSGRHSAMTGAESRIDPREGGEFSYFGGGVRGVTKTLEENARIVQELRADGWPDGHYATVTYELKPQADGQRTLAAVNEEGIPSEHFGQVVEGWQSYWEQFADFVREEKVGIVRRFVEEYKNRQTPDAVDEFVAEDCLIHLPLPGLPQGREGMRINGQMMCTAFPDVHAEREFFVTEGDIVIERANVTATHQAELIGIPATGRGVTWSELHAYRVTGGIISEIWSEADFMGVMVQIGAVTMPAS